MGDLLPFLFVFIMVPRGQLNIVPQKIGGIHYVKLLSKSLFLPISPFSVIGWYNTVALCSETDCEIDCPNAQCAGFE